MFFSNILNTVSPAHAFQSKALHPGAGRCKYTCSVCNTGLFPSHGGSAA